jgi:uncharacterized cupin superfamily protein
MTTSPKPNARINRPINRNDVPWEAYEQDGVVRSQWKHLTKAAGGPPYKVGFAIEILMPGQKSAAAHWHTLEEEHVYIIEGTLTVRVGEARHIMIAGDYIRFPAGEPTEHVLFNHGQEPCKYIIVGEKNEHDICYYPDSNKVGRVTREMFLRSDTRDYGYGEPD